MNEALPGRRARCSRRVLALAALLLWGCASPDPFEGVELVDLSHTFDERTIYWPTARRFELERVAHGRDEAGRWYASNDFAASEHGGTHIDAPIHFAEGTRSAEEIPLERLVGPARVVDAREACARDPDHALTADEIRTHEARHGPIPPGAVVLVRTGWEERWPDAARYLGTAARGSTEGLSFPGLSPGAAHLLVERKIDLVGIDTASLDPGSSTDFAAHRVLAEAGVPGLENVMNLARLPPTGATVIALPMKIAGGTGGPCRVVALLPRR